MNEEETLAGGDIHLMLGLSESSSLAEIKKAYSRMLKALYSSDLAHSKPGLERLKGIRQRIQTALEQLPAHQAISSDKQEGWTRPKIGQMLVAGGLLTLAQLDAALEIQRNTKAQHIFIGEILVDSGYITRQQLREYLKHQEVMRLPPDHETRWGQRLVKLGLVTDDQLKVALIDQNSKGQSLRQSFIDRGWLSAEVLDRIF